MKVVLSYDLGEEFVKELRATFPTVDFRPAYTTEEQLREVPDAEVQFGVISRDVFPGSKATALVPVHRHRIRQHRRKHSGVSGKRRGDDQLPQDACHLDGRPRFRHDPSFRSQRPSTDRGPAGASLGDVEVFRTDERTRGHDDRAHSDGRYWQSCRATGSRVRYGCLRSRHPGNEATSRLCAKCGRSSVWMISWRSPTGSLSPPHSRPRAAA